MTFHDDCLFFYCLWFLSRRVSKLPLPSSSMWDPTTQSSMLWCLIVLWLTQACHLVGVALDSQSCAWGCPLKLSSLWAFKNTWSIVSSTHNMQSPPTFVLHCISRSKVWIFFHWTWIKAVPFWVCWTPTSPSMVCLLVVAYVLFKVRSTERVWCTRPPIPVARIPYIWICYCDPFALGLLTTSVSRLASLRYLVAILRSGVCVLLHECTTIGWCVVCITLDRNRVGSKRILLETSYFK